MTEVNRARAGELEHSNTERVHIHCEQGGTCSAHHSFRTHHAALKLFVSQSGSLRWTNPWHRLATSLAYKAFQIMQWHRKTTGSADAFCVDPSLDAELWEAAYLMGHSLLRSEVYGHPATFSWTSRVSLISDVGSAISSVCVCVCVQCCPGWPTPHALCGVLFEKAITTVLRITKTGGLATRRAVVRHAKLGIVPEFLD